MWVEAESSKVGQVLLPAVLWRAMKAAGGVEVRVGVGERTRYLLRTYRHFVEQPDELKGLVTRLRHTVGEGLVAGWCADIDAGRWEAFVSGVLERHYDPSYRHSRGRDFANVTEVLGVDDLSDDGVRRVAAELASRAPSGAGCLTGTGP